MEEAYTSYSLNTELLDYKDWIKQQRDKEPQFLFWHQILELESLVLAHVKASRTGNFELYMITMEHLMAWVFGTDQLHYSRNLPVHLRDLYSMKTRHPYVYQQFMKGNFVGHKSHRAFSGLPTDQLHEQLIRVLKGDGGIIGLTDYMDNLREFMVLAPELSCLIKEFEEEDLNKEYRHHDQ